MSGRAALILNALFAHHDRLVADRVAKRLLPELVFISVESVSTLGETFQHMVRTPYDVCFVDSELNGKELQAFFRDMEVLENSKECVFVQLFRHQKERDKAGLGSGFSALMSECVTQKDREDLWPLLYQKYHRQEVRQRSAGAEDALGVLLRKIDLVASDKKRGRNQSSHDRSISDVIADQVDFDQEVLSAYFDSLINKVEQAAPHCVTELNVPEKILKRKLPCLTAKSYTGASARVWRKLVKQHGVAEGSGDAERRDQDQPKEAPEKQGKP